MTTETTTDHETIRRWAESRNARPVSVRGTGSVETTEGGQKSNFNKLVRREGDGSRNG